MFRKPKDLEVKKIKIRTGKHSIPALVISKGNKTGKTIPVLWIHGGGYFLGIKEQVYRNGIMDLVRKFNVTVISPGYRLALFSPYPAAVNDCYDTLVYIKNHADELNVDADKIMVGGESAGGGLSAAVSMMARDKNKVKVAYQFPLYPMLDNFDTESSKNNHGKVWNTRRNHLGWKLYLRKNAHEEVSPYASPSRQKDYSGLPPCYTFVGDGEPFYKETLDYVDNLNKAGVKAAVDVYHSDYHAFAMLKPDGELSKEAVRKFHEEFRKAVESLREKS